MQSSQIPVKFVAPFAHAAGGGYITSPIPVTSPGGNATGLDTGFPPQTDMVGGAPRIQDFNGAFNQITAWNLWQGGQGVPYDATYQTAIGGYWKGAYVLAATGNAFWISTVENNMTDPDTGGAGWQNLGTLTAAAIAAALGYVPQPPGSLQDFAMNTPPSGWLICDGSLISRTTYAPLFSAIGTTWGAGDGSTTFAIPDLRGYFTRGWSDGSSVDSGRAFASVQQDAMQGHFHSVSPYQQEGTGNGYTGTASLSPTQITQTGSPTTDGTNGTPRTAAETRPVNYAVLKAIKT